MGRRFKIQHYIVDPNRNEISCDGQVTSVHKKAMSVLSRLAQANGKVVTSEDIMDSVWPESVVAPNSLQRCILQIRKALNDSGKSQHIIKTHPKLGYSINSPIIWMDDESSTISLPETSSRQPAFWRFGTIATASAITLFTVLFIVMRFFSSPLPPLAFSHVRPLTASDEKETNPKYSPDGNWVIFHRYGNEQEHHLWVLNPATSEEYRLTQTPKRYGTIGWSPEGNQITFVVHSAKLQVSGNSAIEDCWALHTLDFYAALQKPLDSVARTPCRTHELRVARWVDSNRLSAIRNAAITGNNALISFDMAKNDFTQVFASSAGRIYSYDYSPVTQTFAVVSRTHENEHYIESVDLAGELQSKALIRRHQNNSKHEYYNLNYHPDGKQLSTHTEYGVYSVSLNGELTKVNTLAHRALLHPYFHPTQNKMLAVQNRMDQDIALMVFNGQQRKMRIKTIARSNELDANAKFQPGTDNIAFISNRSGVNQLWLKHGDKVQPITDSNKGVQHIEFGWSPNGESIAAVMSDSLHILTVNNAGVSNLKKVTTPFSTYSVMQWTSPSSLLVMARENNLSAIFLIANIHSTSPQFQRLEIPEVNARWAAVHANIVAKQASLKPVKVVYLTEADELWVYDQSTQKNTKISQHDTSKTLTYHQGGIYGINNRHQIWRYDVDSKQLRTVITVDPDIRYISDIRNEQALLTRTHSHHMEIVEFH